MLFKKIISGIAIFFFMHGVVGSAQEDEISAEDLEIIENLESNEFSFYCC